MPPAQMGMFNMFLTIIKFFMPSPIKRPIAHVAKVSIVSSRMTGKNAPQIGKRMIKLALDSTIMLQRLITMVQESSFAKTICALVTGENNNLSAVFL